MRIKDIRSEFSVLIIEPVVNTADNYSKMVSMAGFQSSHCSDPIEAISVVRSQAPHMILLSISDVDVSLKSIEALASISSEFQIILMVNKSQVVRALSLVERGLVFDYVTLPMNSSAEIITKIDRAAEKLFLTFQVEELEQKNSTKVNTEELKKEPVNESSYASFVAPPLIAVADGLSAKMTHHQFEEDVLKLSHSRDPGQALAAFLQLMSDRLNGRAVAYFKFLPTHLSFVFSEGVGTQLPSKKNIGVDLRNSSIRDASQIFSHLESVPEIAEMLRAVFQAKKFSLLIHALDGEPLGFFAVLSDLDHDERNRFRVLERIFSLVYQRNVLTRARDQFETRDLLTGLLNIQNFEARLKEELSRSRRTGLAVSLIAFELDKISELENKIGTSNVDTILKMMSVIVRKTSRSNDIAGTLSRGKFAVILPHTDAAGAKVRATRLKKMIGSTRFPMTETEGTGFVKILAALGEYPTLSSDSESLVRSTLFALSQARFAGDEIQVVEVPEGFQADFLPHKFVSPAALEHRGRSR